MATLEAAISRCEHYVRADPGNPHLLVALGDLYHRSGRLIEANSCFQKCLVHPPTRRLARRHLAAVMLSQHRFIEAECILHELLEETPDDASLLHELGVSLYHQNRLQEGIKALDHAQENGLRHARNDRYRVRTLHRLGDINQAMAACRQWLTREPSETVYGYLALLEMSQGNLSEAHHQAQTVLARNPSNMEAALVEGMWHLEHRDIDRACAFFNLVILGEPESARGWIGMALAHAHRGANGVAVDAIESVASRVPADSDGLLALAWMRIVAGDLRAAEQAFREAVWRNRTCAEAHGGLAFTLLLEDRRAEAHHEGQVARQLSSGDSDCVWIDDALHAIVQDGERVTDAARLTDALAQSMATDGKSILQHIQQCVRRHVGRMASDAEFSES